jgi:hypothetical protein
MWLNRLKSGTVKEMHRIRQFVNLIGVKPEVDKSMFKSGIIHVVTSVKLSMKLLF